MNLIFLPYRIYCLRIRYIVYAVELLVYIFWWRQTMRNS